MPTSRQHPKPHEEQEIFDFLEKTKAQHSWARENIRTENLDEWRQALDGFFKACQVLELPDGKTVNLRVNPLKVTDAKLFDRKLKDLRRRYSSKDGYGGEHISAMLDVIVEALFPGTLKDKYQEEQPTKDIIKKTPNISPTFRDGYGSILSSVPYWAIQQAIMKAKEWEFNEEGLAFFPFKYKDAKGHVLYREPRGESGLFFNTLPTLDLDVLDALSVMVNELLAAKYPGDGIVLNYRTIIKARLGKNISKLKIEEAARWTKAINEAQPLYLSMVFTPRKSNKKRESINVGGHVVLTEPLVWKALNTGEVVVYEWRVVSGAALLEIARQFPQETMFFPQSLIAFDPKKQEKAKKLGYYFVWQFRTRANRGDYKRRYVVGNVLEATGIKISDDSRNFTRFKTRFNNAMDLLPERCVIGGWQWDGDEPRSRQDWLKAGFYVWPTEQTLEHYAPSLSGAKRFLPLLPPPGGELKLD